MNTRTKETIRYLGYGNHAVDEQTFALIEESFRELDKIASRRIIYRFFEIIPESDDSLYIGKLHIISKNLSKNLKNCKQAVLIGATLGTAVDQLMRRYQITDMSKAVVMQAAAAAMLEEYLDECQEKIRKEIEMEGKGLRPRFSPGYGDFDISNQKMVLRMLDADKTIGLTMTASYMLTPTKSVTAVIGICELKESCNKTGCEVCDKKDCIYRRNA
ncbi:MAG: vitamin B12 dependent-methionine synthase activation domain-containing protein [Eubacteriales bacterium]|nr:vitamin B12 dependent-methionine synthase activation domain-containing protein [Eubacteriales bacterium]